VKTWIPRRSDEERDPNLSDTSFGCMSFSQVRSYSLSQPQAVEKADKVKGAKPQGISKSRQDGASGLKGSMKKLKA
jgi:hypothetical protein